MDFDSIIQKRKSVRAFKNKRASWKEVLEAIDAANQGPFASNQNHLHFVIIEEPDMIDKIAQACDQLWMNRVGILVAVISNDQGLESMFGERGRVYSRQQSGAAISTFLLKITELGLASCWVGAYDDDEIKRLLKVPSGMQVEAILPVGYEKDKTAKKPKKKSLEATVYWEGWEKSQRPEFFEEQPETYGLG